PSPPYAPRSPPTPTRDAVSGRLEFPVRGVGGTDAGEHALGVARLAGRGGPGAVVAAKHVEDHVDSLDDRLEIVAALEDRDEAAAGRLLGDGVERLRHGGEAGGRHAHAAQGVAVVAIEAGGDEDEV